MEPTKDNVATLDIYKDISFLKNKRLKFSSTAPFTPTYVQSNLSLSSDPAGMYASRIQGRQIMLENPVRDSRAKKESQEKRVKRKAQRDKKKAGVMGKREAREKGVWRFDESQARFDLFMPLHQLWMGYMSELLGLPQLPSSPTTPTAEMMPGSTGMHPKLLKADFHGSIMTVRQSKNPCLVNLSGIVIHETENAFKVVTQGNKIKLLPKQNSIFAFFVPLHSTLPPTHDANTPFSIPPPDAPGGTVLDRPHIEFELYGNQFRFRSADRAGRKFKHKETIEL